MSKQVCNVCLTPANLRLLKTHVCTQRLCGDTLRHNVVYFEVRFTVNCLKQSSHLQQLQHEGKHTLIIKFQH